MSVIREILLKSIYLVMLLVANVMASQAWAQACGGDYEVVRGDSLSAIASQVYDDRLKWTVIYSANVPIIGLNPDLIEIGQLLRIPCLDGSVVREEPAPTVADVQQDSESASDSQPVTASGIRLLTGSDYEPFTERKMLNGGLITDIVVSALASNPARPEFRLDWEDDWSLHLSPLLSEHEYDVGFPWLQPDCSITPDDFRCQNFIFSNPMFQLLILLYTSNERPITFNTDADIVGKTLCRPKGYFTHDLEKDGRLWLTENKIKLEQPASVDECFVLLANGTVDAVALNEFTGRSAMNRLLLDDKVSVVESRPLSIEGLHMVVHKEHPNARPLIGLLNDSLTELQLSGESNNIVDIHLTNFWSKLR